MTKTDVGEICCKVLSIYSIIYALALTQFPISMLNPAFSHGRTRLVLATTFVPSTLLVIFAAVLWKGGNKIRLISGSDHESEPSASGITPAILQSIAFSVAGILVLTGALSETTQCHIIKMRSGELGLFV